MCIDVLRREDGHVIRKTFEFEAELQGRIIRYLRTALDMFIDNFCIINF